MAKNNTPSADPPPETLDDAFFRNPGVIGEIEQEEPTVPNPLDALKPTGTLEGDAKREVSEIVKIIKADRKALKKKMQDRTDTEFWFQVVFQTRAQKAAFLTACKLIEHGDKYIDGLVFSESLGIDLPPENVKLEAWKPKYQDIPRIPRKEVK